MKNTFNSRKNWKILSSYAENTVYCSHVYNLAQKFYYSVQIVKITGHALRRKGSLRSKRFLARFV